MAALRPLSRSFESSLDLLNIAVLEMYSVLFGPLEMAVLEMILCSYFIS